MKIIVKKFICEENIWRKLLLHGALVIEKYMWILRKKQKFLKLENDKS